MSYDSGGHLFALVTVKLLTSGTDDDDDGDDLSAQWL